MSELGFAWSRPAGRPFWIGVLLASVLTLPARPAALDDKHPVPGSGRISLEELNQDVRPRIRRLAEVLFEDQKAREDWIANRPGPEIKEDGEQAAYLKAKLARAIAELESKRYTQIDAPLERATIEAEIRVAEAAIGIAEEDLHAAEAVAAKAKEIEPNSILQVMSLYDADLALKSAELTLAKEKSALEVAKGKLTIFEEYSNPKQKLELRSKIEKAKSDELAKEQSFILEKDAIDRRKKNLGPVRGRATWRWSPLVKALNEAVGLERETRSMLNESPPGEPRDQSDWDQKLAATAARLRVAVSKAEQIYDDLTFEPLLRDIHSSAPRAAARAFVERMKALSPEDRKAFQSARPAELDAILKKAEFSDSEIERVKAMRARGTEP